MSGRSDLQKIAREIARGADVESGLMDLGDILSAIPTAPLIILDLAAAESRKKSPDEAVCVAYGYMLGRDLERLRYGAEAGRRADATLIETVRDNLAALIETDKLQSFTIIAVASAFARAGVDVGERVRTVVAERMQDVSPEAGVPMEGDLAAMLHELAEASDNDPFAIYAQLIEMADTLPAEAQLPFANGLLKMDDIGVREAALGWFLTSPPALRPKYVEMFAEAGRKGLLSPASATRLAVMGSWLSEDERALLDLDLAIPKASSVVKRKPAAIRVERLLMCDRDGAGAQTMIAVLKRGRQYSIAAVLTKHGFGIRDAWCSDWGSASAVSELLFQLSMQAPHHRTSSDTVKLLLEDALAHNRAVGTMPPFGLLQVIEYLGLDIRPQLLPVADLVDHLLGQIEPEDKNAEAAQSALKASAHWDAQTIDSWFEDNDDVRDAVAGIRGKTKRRDLVLTRFLPKRRDYWAQVIAWGALARMQEAPDDDMEWEAMALVAREILGEKPLKDIPIMRIVAETTAEATTWS